MKSRIIWAVVVVAAIAGFYFVTIRPAMQPPPKKLKWPDMAEFRPPEIPPPPLPTPDFGTVVLAPPALPPPRIAQPVTKPARQIVPIQNGTTIDFSLGVPMVKPQGDDQEALERALKEMAEATKDTTFNGKQP
jgi:hypothetical protein